MIRIATLALVLAGMIQVHAQEGSLDPLFETVPFGEWLAGGDQTAFRWSTKIPAPFLSQHQRLATRVEAYVDGAELAKRRGPGELVFLLQFTDADGRIYQDHHSIDLEKVDPGVRKSNIVYSQPVFLRPGDYQVAIALFATATKEHSVRKELVRIAPLKNDPLPDSWNRVPPVEFIGVRETPDNWYLPDIRGKVYLPVDAQRKLRIEAIVNLTPSERSSGSFRAQDRTLSSLLPALKALTQMQGPNVSLNVSLLDLTRRKVTYRQENVHELDWERMGESLKGASPATIDIKSLEDRAHNAAFFVSEVERRAAGEDEPVVIVLSSPVEFEQGQQLRQASAVAKAHVIYIRYHAPSRPTGFNTAPPLTRSGLNAPLPIRVQRPRIQVDQLEPTLRALNPQLFDTHSAEEFRKVLADLVREAAHW